MKLTRIPSLKTVEAFGEHVHNLGLDLHLERQISTGEASALTRPLQFNERTIGNRWAIQPMEGWDGTATGGVTEPMLRRWQRFGQSGAKMIWGGEAMAVRGDGRANPHQLIINEANQAGIAQLRETLSEAHQQIYGRTNDVLLGFQLTHSGRFCRPSVEKGSEPRVAFRHPLLDPKFKVTSDAQILSDDELKRLVDDYAAAAKIAAQIGADFVDVKHCHGYLLHEFLAAHTRPGPYGGSFENRTRLMREIVSAIRAVTKLEIGVRLSAFDLVPFKPDPTKAEAGKLGPGIPEDYSHCLPYRYAFGVNAGNPVEYDLTETVQFLALLETMGIKLVNLSAGSPYYNPHIQRPAIYPPSDGYQPPEDPLVGVARQINVTRELKAKFPKLIIVGTGYSYLQEYLPHVAEYYVRNEHVDIVGLGRAVLSYPNMLVDATRKGKLEARYVCRTFSDCTTAPRNGLRSGCYPLDDYYKNFEDAPKLKAIKKAVGGA